MPAATLAALGDDVRLGIVEALATGDRSVNELVGLFPISQPAISRHLRILRDAGVVESKAVGKLRIYQLRADALADLGSWAERMRRSWEMRFDALDSHLADMKEQRRDR